MKTKDTNMNMMRLTWKMIYPLIACVLAVAPLSLKAEGPAPKKGQARFEVRWMQSMIDHHHMAVMMGELCAERAVHTNLLTMCEEIVTTQAAEIEQMQAWLLEWYGEEYEPQMKPNSERLIDDLAALDGEEFEIAFMELMIPHHSSAIRQAKPAVRRAYHPELQDLAADIIDSQSAEIEQMREWLCDWYDLCQSRGRNGSSGRTSNR
jgi:uncharacterized protein (DUF305 family)